MTPILVLVFDFDVAVAVGSDRRIRLPGRAIRGAVGVVLILAGLELADLLAG